MSRSWILPMAGHGTRVSSLGRCKPAISVAGRPILAWCLTGLSAYVMPSDVVVAITTDVLERDFALRTLCRDWMDRLNIRARFDLVTVPETPPGPAASVYAARDVVPATREVVCVNVDQYCEFQRPAENTEWDAFLPLYVNTTGKSSYAELDGARVIKVEEKRLISCYASAGIYGFRDAKTLFAVIAEAFSGPPHRNGEYYLGPSINGLIARGGRVVPTTVTAKFDLGNVPDIEHFQRVAERWHA
jgi:UDP-N-acetylglucosamine diphosphorylase / glucose-1-phosphate thymidylyltransferase / UDP-N-acetylgalactosamine diphosphorylase / glucosamine-1-phosphate N-acetyltransferase / galactosamine-1-phosphate N-acetyltransferase